MIVVRNDLDSHLQLSPHFKARELSCRCGKCYISIIDSNLLSLLETMRKVWGLPLSPSSVYRCQQHNRNVSGVPYSKHCAGRAVDLPLPKEKESHSTFISLAKAIFPYVKVYDTFIHCDLRDS